ncbi:recombinase family protein, partial [Escherichia coli]|uniref:recombinase family protein n=1 Tax=Escherichia coli TaxID=562 RepID=UPI002025D3FD
MASGNEKNHRVRVAQYLRMSTDHQQYSLHNQSEYIKDYAEKNNMEIAGNDSNLLIVFYVQIMPDDFVM